MTSVTSHALQRWGERFGKRSALRDIREEFTRAEKWKPNRVRRLGVRIDSSRRYYVTELCIFVVAAQNGAIITILQRKRT